MKENPDNLLPAHLHFRGDFTCQGNVTVATRYVGKIKAKKHLTFVPESEFEGIIQSHTLRIDPGAKINAEVKVGPLLPLIFRWPRFFKKEAPPTDE